ncbi:hypothetical protein [Methylobacter psychrophilus]|jgi:Spy/CpxP family protein refolding chaperone|uniref:hypothetical protein n=1 Tax=Methylobacter psychrophilus TaxID=96941 RepID=UPI0021D48789|nr:hypothetical protein [Methylobacter psychrophilus]
MLLKKIAATLIITASMLAVSPIAFSAEEKVDKNALVEDAANKTEASMLEAKSLLEKGGESDQTLKALNDARQSVKEFRYEATERARQKLNGHLKSAREAFINNDNEKALTEIKAGLVVYSEMRKVYDASH